MDTISNLSRAQNECSGWLYPKGYVAWYTRYSVDFGTKGNITKTWGIKGLHMIIDNTLESRSTVSS